MASYELAFKKSSPKICGAYHGKTSFEFSSASEISPTIRGRSAAKSYQVSSVTEFASAPIV